MAKNRFNTTPPAVDYSPKKKEKQEVILDFSNCLHCDKVITEGYYGRFGNGGVCSKTCNTAQEAKPKDFGEQHEKTVPTTFTGRVFSPG